MSRPAVSYHLKVLKEANLVNFRREDTKNYYYLQHKLGEINQSIN
ncbi:ArsR/SmtB family transcription factor [Latilactobacillus graminis]|nr:ArsR family transcriptional regulator [Latilactobacillus graminis]